MTGEKCLSGKNRSPLNLSICCVPQVAEEFAGKLVFVTVNSDEKDAEPVIEFFGIAAGAEFPVVCPSRPSPLQLTHALWDAVCNYAPVLVRRTESRVFNGLLGNIEFAVGLGENAIHKVSGGSWSDRIQGRRREVVFSTSFWIIC